MITVFLVDDHEIVRRGVQEMLAAEPDITVVGEAGTMHAAIGRIAATRPQIAVLDVRLPDGNGIDLCREIAALPSAPKCLILTAYDDDDALLAAALAGASGYVMKDIRGTGLVDAIRSVAAGNTLNPSLLDSLTSQLQSAETSRDPIFDSLHLRERQILALIAEGLTNRQIGVHLSLTEKTVKNYVSTLLRKLGLERRTQAVAYELERKHTVD